jgi:hypothetical protein
LNKIYVIEKSISDVYIPPLLPPPLDDLPLPLVEEGFDLEGVGV